MWPPSDVHVLFVYLDKILHDSATFHLSGIAAIEHMGHRSITHSCI